MVDATVAGAARQQYPVSRKSSFRLYTDDKADKDRLLSFSGAGQGCRRWSMATVTVWDSLFDHRISRRKIPASALWPEDRAVRAPCAVDLGGDAFGLHGAAQRMRHEPASADPCRCVCRTTPTPMWRGIHAIWAECHQRYGKAGPFLFGAFSGADAMFAPVLYRFRTYAIPVQGDARHYVDAMNSLAGFPGMDPRRAGRNAGHRKVRCAVNPKKAPRGVVTAPCAIAA